MSDSDSFIKEVTEEVRRDRMFRLFRRYGWIPVLVVVVIVSVAAANEWRKARDRAAAEAFGDAVLAALAAGDPAARLTMLDAVPAEGAAAAVLHFLRAAEAEAAGNTAAALAALDRVAGDNSLPESYRQLALLKRVALPETDMTREERRAAMEQMAMPGQAFRPLAMEQLALIALEAGGRDEALGHLRAILDDPATTTGLRQRVTQLILVLGGDVRAG